MSTPIIPYKPKLVFQELDRATELPATPTPPPPVDATPDVRAVDLSPDTEINTVETFLKKFRTMGDTEWSLSVTIVVTKDTTTNWASLVGKLVEARVYDRNTDTKYRMVKTEIPFDPSLGGSTDVGADDRSYDWNLPVYSDPVWVTVA